MKKFLSFLLACVILLCMIPVSFAAEAEQEQIDSVEIALLLDVSGSMDSADPLNSMNTRLSIEAAQQFVFNYPTETDMYIKVILYNSSVYSGFESLNVSTETGRDKYIDNMQLILKDGHVKEGKEDVVPDITCWEYQTNIGAALETATEFLSESTADKKAVILFTDGKIDLGNDEKEEASLNQANESKSTLENSNVPIYCIGLNKGGSVDEEFLKNLSSSDVTPGKTSIVTNASDLGGVFQEIYTYLFEDSMLDAEVDSITVSPEVAEEKSLRIYGQAIREANISLVSSAALHSIKVISPSGVVVADIDYKTGKSNISAEHCVIDITPSHATANIKLVQPMDGDWILSIKGEKSTVMMSKIYLFDLKLRDSITTDTVYVGDVFKFDTTIYNAESNTHVSSSGLYEGESGAVASADVVNTATKNSVLYGGTLNGAKNGYDFAVDFATPGVYDVNMYIKHSQFDIEAKKTVNVVAPELKLELAGNGTSNVIKAYLVNPLTGEAVSSVPAYLASANGKITVTSGETVVCEHVYTAADMATGSHEFAFEAPTAGTYSASTSFATYDSTLASDVFTLTVEPSKIDVSDDKIEFSYSGLSAEFSETVKLSDIFKDSDGDKLSYTVKVSDDSVAEAEIDGDKLKIDVIGFGEANIKVTATDNRGAEASYTVSVAAKSTMGLVIGIAIAAVVIIIGLIVFIIIVNKRKVIRFGFRVKLVKESDGIYTEAVYNIGRLATNRYAKPTMKLDELISPMNTFAQVIRNDIKESDLSEVSAACSAVSVTGLPFKRAFNIMLNGKKKGTFVKSQVRVELADVNCSVVFGSVYDFEADGGYGF